MEVWIWQIVRVWDSHSEVGLCAYPIGDNLFVRWHELSKFNVRCTHACPLWKLWAHIIYNFSWSSFGLQSIQTGHDVYGLKFVSHIVNTRGPWWLWNATHLDITCPEWKSIQTGPYEPSDLWTRIVRYWQGRSKLNTVLEFDMKYPVWTQRIQLGHRCPIWTYTGTNIRQEISNSIQSILHVWPEVQSLSKKRAGQWAHIR